jgi:hypothetical protein
MPLLPLSENVSGVTNFFGDVTLRLGPTAHGVMWEPEVASVRCATNAREGVCNIYTGHDATPDNFVDNTQTASTGDSSGNVRTRGSHMSLGNFVWAVFTGCDPGTVATLTVTGTVNLDG